MAIINFILKVIDSPIFLRFGVPAVLLLAIMGGYFFGKPKKPKVKPFALLESIQYVQELYLVSYRYEEMILLGVPPKFDRKQDELKDLRKLRVQLADSLRADSAHNDAFRQAEAFANESLRVWSKREDSLRKVVKAIRRRKRKSEPFKLWKAAQDSVTAAKKRIRISKKERLDSDKLLAKTVKSLSKLDDQIERLNKNWKASERLNEAEALVITPVEVSAFVDLRKARFIFSDGGQAARIDSLRDSLTNDNYILSQQYLDAIAQSDSSADSVDVVFENNLSHQIDSIGLLPDRRLDVYLPYPQLDQPVVDLDTTRTVNLARSLTPSIYRNYFEVFQALAQEVRDIKEDVKEKAIKTGILNEAEEVAETYVRSFVASLPQYSAYNVQVIFTDPATISRLSTAAQVE